MNYFLNLKMGWNLVSLPLENINFEKFVENKEILEIKNFEKTYNVNVPKNLNTLKEFTIDGGYIIKVNEDVIIELNGDIYKKDIKYILNVGWNLIGYPYKISTSILKLKNFIEIKNFKSSYNKNIIFDLNNLKLLEINNGYWVYVEEETEIIIKNPIIYNQVKENKISGYILEESIIKNDLINYKKEYYVLNIPNDYTLEASKYSLKYINYSRLRKIFNKLDKIKFIIFYGLWNGEEKSVGIKFCDDLEVLDIYKGIIHVNPREFNEKIKYLEIYFNDDRKNKILFNITQKLISVVYDISYILVTNLDFQINKEEINISSKFLNNYYLEDLLISDLLIQKNNILLEIINYNLIIEDNILKLKIVTYFERINLIIRILDNESKFTGVKLEIENKSKEYKLQIIKNKNFKMDFFDNDYIFNIDWIGTELLENNYIVEKFSTNTKYLYWFNFKNINFSSILFNNFELLPTLKMLEINKDYLIFEIEISNIFYKMFLLKSKFNYGYIDLTLDAKYKNEIKYNLINRKFLEWNIYNGTTFKIDNIEISLKWTGDFDENGYSIKNVDVNKQRLIYEKVNTYEIFNLNNFSLKLHYSIGKYNSIDLTVWDSYYNFLEYFKKIILKISNIINSYELKFPYNDDILHRNGGDSYFDIYITEIENEFIKGSTVAEMYNYYTKNKNDVISHIVLSKSLDKNWLEVVLIHEFFHAIHGTYDWFDNLWISEGLAVTFEYMITNSNLSEFYFIPCLLENRYLSLSYSGNFKMENDYVKTINLKNNKFSDKGRIILYIEKMFTKNGEVNFYEGIENDIIIINKNDESIKIEKIEIINYIGIYNLKIILDSNRKIDNMIFNMKLKKDMILKMIPSFSTRPYSTFLFFKYLEENYGAKNIFKNILNESIKFDNFELIDRIIKKVNPKSNINDEILNFWCACEIMSDNLNLEKKYRFENAKLWENKYIKNNITLDINFNKKIFKINNLEPSGCYIFKLILEHKAKFIISKLKGIHAFIINKNENDSYDVNKITFSDIFNNSKIIEISLIIIADITFIQNEIINLTYYYI